MDDAEVSKISDFSLSSSGTCPGDRPKDKKKDTKFVPTCNPGEKCCRPSIPRRQIMVPIPWHHDRQAVQLDPGVKGGMLHFFLHRNDRVRQSSLLAGPALSIFV